MPEKSNENNNMYKPKMTGFLVAAIALVLLVVIVLISTVFILADRKENGGQTSKADKTDQTVKTDKPIQSDETTVETGDPNVPEGTTLPDVTDAPGTPTTPTRTPVKVTPDENSVAVSGDAVKEGSLLLLDNTHPYGKDPSLLITRSAMNALTADKLLSDYGFVRMMGVSGNYSVAGTNRFANQEAVEYFGEMMKDFVAAGGHTDVQVRNAYYFADAKDIESVEHATGYYLDLEIFRKEGTYPLNYESMKKDYYDWFVSNCWKYGFVHVRDIDRRDEKYSTFRFVGAAHAAAMNKYGFDMAQYISAVSAYSYDNRMKITDGFGWEWWVYYVKSAGDTTAIKVLGNENSYRISGNNVNGYVVAINSSCFG